MWLDPNHQEEVFAIVYKDNNKVIGTTGVQHLNEVIKDTKNLYVKNEIESGKILYEIGIVVSKCYWNKGIATDVLKLIEEYIFVEKNADVIIACHYEANIGSKRIQEKNNYKKVFEFERDKKWWKTDCTTMVVRKKSYNEWNDNN